MRLPFFLLSFIIFVAVLSHRRRLQDRHQKEVYDNYMERELAANSTRKKDISHLDYLPFTLDALPIGKIQDDILNSCETTFETLSGKRMINLSDKSNTDLKLLYGPANLNDLSEYDDNYHLLAATLLQYAQRERELNQMDDAISILEYAMSLHMDHSRIYLLLAELYQQTGSPEKIHSIHAVLNTMDEKFRSSVLQKLAVFHIDE